MFRKVLLLCALAVALTAGSAMAESKKIRVASDCTWPPMEFLSADKKPIGFSVDLLAELGKVLNVEFDIQNVPWDGIFSGVAAGKYDMVSSSTTITPERQKLYLFSTPYYDVVQSVVMPADKNIKDLSGLKGLKVGGQIGTTGIFVCLTGEAGVSTETYVLSQPFTLCHELGHSLAVARENEANYLGFLACRASRDELFRYAGWYSAFIYCYNALYAESPASARALWDRCSEEVIHDSDVHVEHNRQYEGKIQEAAQAVNDAYLRSFDEPGVKSYGLVVDYLIAEYLKQR